MKERPILFSASMVRAILSGMKTQTRRVVKPQPPSDARGAGCITTFSDASSDGAWWWLDSPDLLEAGVIGDEFRCPYGKPGDRLWVRETWAYYGGDEYLYQRNTGALLHRADELIVEGLDAIPGGRWRPSIHMPRWACRLVLEITDVRVERLQDISREDATAEGVDAWAASALPPAGQLEDPRVQFALLWQAINGATSWDANPWVWALTFRRLP